MGSSHLTTSSVLVLQAIARGYRYGFDVMDATGLPSGTVYPALRRLAKQGCVTASWEEQDVARQANRPRRRYYRITPRGRKVLEKAVQRFRVLAEPLPEAEPDEAVGEAAPEVS